MKVFITGITGTLGTALSGLHHRMGDIVVGCSRSESKAVRWKEENPWATVIVSDAADLCVPYTSCGRELNNTDRVYHLAALKHVDLCEQFPAESVNNNITLTQHIVSACKRVGTELVFASTDKACLPGNVYGATKLIAERIVTEAGYCAVRLGNLVGSSGSVFEKWAEQVSKGQPIKLTDPNMTRFFMGVEHAASFLNVAPEIKPGHVVVPMLKSASMGDLAKIIIGNLEHGKVIVTGTRPGETTHQWLISPSERYTPHRLYKEYLILGEGDNHDGVCSYTAPRWDSYQLLRLAGLH